ncbi:unnamed protein product [Pleuronectes platessa]|uniref:Uncharacterized protein n=1 Tax=Pleuronectes platessa TaxID=8262 RepID=A0A9N7VU14_PLEPL|nr:unnamed protein product [Pleuronectes platessa]
MDIFSRIEPAVFMFPEFKHKQAPPLGGLPVRQTHLQPPYSSAAALQTHAREQRRESGLRAASFSRNDACGRPHAPSGAEGAAARARKTVRIGHGVVAEAGRWSAAAEQAAEGPEALTHAGLQAPGFVRPSLGSVPLLLRPLLPPETDRGGGGGVELFLSIKVSFRTGDRFAFSGGDIVKTQAERSDASTGQRLRADPVFGLEMGSLAGAVRTTPIGAHNWSRKQPPSAQPRSPRTAPLTLRNSAQEPEDRTHNDSGLFALRSDYAL